VTTEIFNDKKRRAVSLRRPSFLSISNIHLLKFAAEMHTRCFVVQGPLGLNHNDCSTVITLRFIIKSPK